MSNYPGEIIQIHIGQAGVQIANACWELYCLEHGIKPCGHLAYKPTDSSYNTFFQLLEPQCKVEPRIVMIDTEPTVIDEIRTGAYRNLFHKDTLITGLDDSGSNFSRGYNYLGIELLERAMEGVRKVAENCRNLRGFLFFRSIGGGTGSGFGSLMIEKLADHYPKTTKIEFLVFPSPSLSSIIVEPYNAVLATHFSMENINVSFIVDNEALYEVCASQLNVHTPTYTNLNRIIGQVVSAFTASQRFQGSTNVTFDEFQTNLVPFPRIHYPLISYAPLMPLKSFPYVNLTVESLTTAVFHPGHQMVRCNPQEGKYMACVLLYRGDVSPTDINSTILNMKRSGALRFVDWSPTGYKVGINAMPPSFVPGGDLSPSNKAVCCIANNTCIRRAWCRLIHKFAQLYNRRAFVYHYVGEGLDEGSLSDASANLCQLVGDYEDVDSLGSK
ncbi:tubulin alpha-1 chain-like [Teleopsis dalmanni]|uniref:tubulin alpha-1 chain-like n=1 Tax=Teleopsis dalmanni TaxID=139649 RepID=UPI0018CFE11B|nr:tubulin alpha-1 chain-like [Teleopsis dalmanni]XP_037955095.1 tubulin alpha-1 chain-like [Teleopsis dalmanni]